jgi:hypothetical protein
MLTLIFYNNWGGVDIKSNAKTPIESRVSAFCK